jgi:endonuclease/exonuclease/phosphatase family metal-dependent hydrolase
MEQFKIRFFSKVSAATILALLCCFSQIGWADMENGFDHHNSSVTVMTQNMDAGTDLGYLFKVPDLLNAATLTYGEVLNSDIPGHTAMLARIIARQQPDLISLQEVTLWQTVSADLKTSVLYDQLDLLLKELKKLNRPYKVVISQTLSQSQLPVDPTLIGSLNDTTIAVGFTDRDVIIARADLKPSELALSHPQKGIYGTLLTLPLGPSNLISKRGWLSVDAKIRGKSFRFVDTHLETVIPFIPQTSLIQVAQAEELLQVVHDIQFPVILAGDFNADAEFAGIGPDQTDTPNKILAAGFTDTWHELHPNNPGFTWPLFLEDPLSPNPNGPIERIDLIYARNLNVLNAYRVGNLNHHFASDHLGVVAKLSIDREKDGHHH